MKVADYAMPRADIYAVEKNLSLNEIVKEFQKSGYSRLPVFDVKLDDTIGFLHLKDLALEYGFNGASAADINYDQIMRKLMFVPPSMPLSVLMQKMQDNRQHMAIVIDEYGGVDGLITIEDLIEVCVGEITDEHDRDTGDDWKELRAGVYSIRARASLQDFGKFLNTNFKTSDLSFIPYSEIDTVGGLVFALCGCIPVKGELISHPSLEYEFEVVEVDMKHIKRLIARKKPDL